MRRLLAMALLPLLLVAGCSDPGSALANAQSTGILTVGVVDNPPSTVPDDGGDVDGPAAEMITAYADSIGAHPSWQVGEIDALAAAVDRGEVDVIIGADGGAKGVTATSSSGSGGIVLVGEQETPLKDSINAWVAEQG
ncbi:transporter substrate-binding domain-containing protein [Janibacter hoylei]|uniref:transporter substrate-binding domain-containing protein n=1 Tax=Janibacter hoylei TaxID=364298 RepID=UPI00223863B6|nr:transporter substrate-binding domain-containing protein [Janibacter hoylei]MCW4602086.1 transporter substrate-binding domain-containing protein [Janibacter hoylei]